MARDDAPSMELPSDMEDATVPQFQSWAKVGASVEGTLQKIETVQVKGKPADVGYFIDEDGHIVKCMLPYKLREAIDLNDLLGAYVKAIYSGDTVTPNGKMKEFKVGFRRQTA